MLSPRPTLCGKSAGNGRLGIALLAHGVPSVLLDPQAPAPEAPGGDHSTDRRCDLCVETTTAASAGGALRHLRVVRALLVGDGSALLDDLEGSEALLGVASVGDTLRACSLVVGMHPDQVGEKKKGSDAHPMFTFI